MSGCKKNALIAYKNHAKTLWYQAKKDWKAKYAAEGKVFNEDWPGDNIWTTRYGGAKAVDSDSDELVDVNRGAMGGKIMTDGINMFEKMTDAEADTTTSAIYKAAGHTPAKIESAGKPHLLGMACKTLGKRFAKKQVDELLAFLANSRTQDELARYPDDERADTNAITENLLDRSKAAKKAAAPPAASIPDTKLSAAGIAYETIEYREQCFLLTKIFNFVDYRFNVLEGEGPDEVLEPESPNFKMEYKRLPYLDEGYGETKVEGGIKVPGPAPRNACLMVDAEHPYAFLNRLTQYPTQQSLLNIATADLSQLQPQIRLFRVRDVPIEGELREVSQEMQFETSTTAKDLESMLGSNGKRGFGAGIKNFTVTYEASNPFAIKKSISATLTIFANTFDELTMDRGGYSYIDLALKTGGVHNLEKLSMEHASNPQDAKAKARLYNLSKLNFRLKAVVGWNQPQGVGIQGFSNAQLVKALENSFITINLTPTTHTFDFDEMGRVNFKIEYLAYIEDFFDEPSYSIFSDKDLIISQKQREAVYQKIKKECKSEDLQKFKEKMGVETAKDLARARASMYRTLQGSGKLRYINLEYSALRKFIEQGAYFDLDTAEKQAFENSIGNVDEKTNLNKSLTSDIKDHGKKTKGKATGTKDRRSATSNQQVSLVYFYASDLLDIILAGIDDYLRGEYNFHIKEGAILQDLLTKAQENVWSDPKDISHQSIIDATEAQQAHENSQLDLLRVIKLKANFERYRLLLGPIEIIDPANPGKSKCVNLGDLPISFKYFMEWLTGRTLKKDKPYYPISNFMNDFMNGLINGFINDHHCFPRGQRQAKQKTYLQQSSITAYKSPPPPVDNKPPSIKQIQAAPDTITKMLHEWRVTIGGKEGGGIFGTSASRLHLERHDATGGKGDALLPIKEFPVLQISGPQGSPITQRDTPYETNYAIYFAGRTAPNEMMNGDITEDQDRGVMHYTAGKDVGIIKNIKFQKTETPGLREVRFEQEGYDGLAQLREVYNVTIDSYANVNAFPGSYIFVNPRGLAPNLTYIANNKNFRVEDLSSYGLGGYFMIKRSTHSFGPGDASTRIDAIWVSEIHKVIEKDEKPEPIPEEERRTKCGANTKGEYISSPPVKDTVDKRDP